MTTHAITSYTTLTGVPGDAIRAIGWVGAHVTYLGVTHKVYSVEGSTFYAFREKDGTVTADLAMTRAAWLTTPELLLLPLDAQIGEGRSFPVPLNSPYLKRGVSLAKQR